jgi:hypothetical protein
MIHEATHQGTTSHDLSEETVVVNESSMRQHVASVLSNPEHEYWKLRVAARLQSSAYEVAVEQPIGEGETIDLVATRSTERVAVEIETDPSDVLANVRKCVAAGYESIQVLATPSTLASRLRSELRRAEFASSINVSVVDALRFVQQAPGVPTSNDERILRCRRCRERLYRTRRRGWRRIWGMLTGQRLYRCHLCGWKAWRRAPH